MFIEHKPKMVPPDGGYGWVAVIGVSIVNLCTRSIEPSFGLLFGDVLAELGVKTTGAALIMSTLDALINFSGLFVGPLIRAFSYRKVSVVGSILVSLGLLLTYPANSMAHILATYSIINGLGVGLTASSTFVALNHYFVKRRGQAVGYSLAGTAFGMMLMPHGINLLLHEYNFRGTVLIIAGISLHSLLGSVVLEPAERHLVPEAKNDTEEEGVYHQEMETIKETDDEEVESPNTDKVLSTSLLAKNLEELEKQTLNLNLTRKSTFPRNFSTMSFASKRRKDSKESIMSSYSRLDFTGSSLQLHLHRLSDASSVQALTANEGTHMRRNMSYPGVHLHTPKKVNSFIREPIEIKPKKEKSMWRKIVELMDLDLLKDPIYLNLLFGLSVFYVAEQNFKMLTPFFLTAINYDKSDIALFLSVQSIADVVARLTLPPICDRVSFSNRTLFMCGIFILGICRSIMAEQKDWTSILIWMIVCGFFRGAAFINFTITISEYAPLEKLPAAFGLHMVGKGLFVVIIGPILGVIRDSTGSYQIGLHAQTFLIMSCCVAWSIEYLIVYFRRRSDESLSDTTTT